MSEATPPAETPTPRTPGGTKRWQPPTPEELQALLPADFAVEQLLGKGGMGAVYRGRQLSLDRPVAIKILSNELDATDTSYAARFKNEARAMAQLSHVGIVSVYSFGETADGLLYIVMEFIEGTDVSHMIAQQKSLRTAHAMAITAHVCDALAFAHERGIIHRDIKPANIMVGYDGVVKVADFGLAKMTVNGETLGLTRSGMAMGTLHYMAPEALILGTAVDHRADIYAVGVMLYQMLTGSLPQGVVDPPSEQVPGLDPRFDAIIAKAMSEDREARYQSIRELRSDLDKTLTKPVLQVEADAVDAPPALPTRSRPQRPDGQSHRPKQSQAGMHHENRNSPLMWVMVAVVVVGLAAWLLLGSSKPDPESRAVVEGSALKMEPKDDDSPTVTMPSSSAPDASKSTVEASTPKVAPAPVSGPPASTAAPNAAAKEPPFVNSLGMKFVSVPLIGGLPDGQQVLFSIWETRVQDYEIFVNETAREWVVPPFPQTQDHPAVGVSWEDATAFCE